MDALRVSEEQFLIMKLCANKSGVVTFKENTFVGTVVVIVIILGLIPSVRYVVDSPDDILGCTFAVMVFTESILLSVSLLIFAAKRQRLRNIFDTLRSVVNKGDGSDFHFFIRANSTKISVINWILDNFYNNVTLWNGG